MYNVGETGITSRVLSRLVQELAEDEETKEDLAGIRSTLRFPI